MDTRELQALYDLALRLSGVHDLDALLQDVVAQARRLLDVDIACLALPGDDGALTIEVTDGSLGPRLRGVRLAPRVGVAGRVADRGEPVRSADYLADRDLLRSDAVDRVVREEGLRTIVGVPLRLRGRVDGVLMIAQRSVRDFTGREMAFLTSLASFASFAAFADAAACATVLRSLAREGACAAPADLGPYRYLLSRSGRADADRFVRATLGPLLDHDERRGGDLVRTADAFLGGGRRHTATAAALHIHPNTLYQRLDKITALLGGGWRDGDRALDVQLALRLHRLAADLGGDPPPNP